MLQRAASNAYSWWWASHIRTKQSKWLEQSLQDMGERVQSVMKLIQEDGDTFAKRAEMYYKKRPELISFVEESFRAYQSLAERYDHISKELQKANSTLASAFPDQFQYTMDDEDDNPPPQGFKRFQEKYNPNIPKAPSKFPAKNLKVIMALNANKNNDAIKKAQKTAANVKKSDLTKADAVNEIDKLQKQILTLQTEKEFAKSSYEKGYAKYWDIEEQIPTLQERISKLQDEFGITQTIKDEEARTLMAESALKSCQQTLAQLLERQAKAVAEAKAEQLRIREAREKLKSLKGEVLSLQGEQIEDSEKGDSCEAGEKLMRFNDEVDGSMDSKELEKLRDKIKEHFDVGPTGSLTVTEMVDKIDELVNKVLGLETSVSSQNAMTHRLRSETDELNSQINTLQNDKSTMTEGNNTLHEQLASMEQKLKGLQDLNRDFEKENSRLETHFTEARSNLDTMSEKLHDVKPDEEIQYLNAMKEMKKKEKKEKKKEKKKKEKEKEEKEKMEKHNSGASTPSEIESDELKSSASTPSMTESDGLQSSATTRSKKESNELESSSSASPGKDDTQAKKQPRDDEPKPTGSEVAQSLATLNKQKVDPVKSHEPASISKDDAQSHTSSNKQEVEPVQAQESASGPKDELGVAQEVKPKEPVSKPTDDPNVAPQVHTSKQEDETDWRQLFMNTKEEYTSTLVNYKDAKKQLVEMEQKTHDDISQIMKQLKELKNTNAKKDVELRHMRQKIFALQKQLEDYKYLKEADDTEALVKNEEPPSPKEDDDDDIKVISADECRISPLEEKLRADVDEILEENLDFWMRFSSSFAQVQKFQNTIKDLRTELEKLERYDERKEGSGQGGSSHGGSSHGRPHINPAMKSDARPIYRHLREIQTELTVWMEQSEKLKEELQSRFSQLCNIENDINRALNTGAEDDDMKFTSFQAAKFQGEVANMQQENHKVADELQAGMDHITILQLELKRTVLRLDDELGFSRTQTDQDDSLSRARNQNQVPLRSFIFGVKPQKKKQSIFSMMHPATVNKRNQHLKTDKSL